MFDGVLFDLDGTLWNATVRICESWNRALARHPEIARPPVTVPEVEATMGLLLPDIARRILPGEREETRAMVLKEQEGEEFALLRTQGGVFYPAVEETLAALSARAKLFVVSNCQDGYIQTFYAAHKLERYFTGFECAGRTGRPKSHNIALVARQYGLARPVYVGDTLLDCTSAREAGVPFLHAAYGFGVPIAGVPAVHSFAGIPAALAAMCPP